MLEEPCQKLSDNSKGGEREGNKGALMAGHGGPLSPRPLKNWILVISRTSLREESAEAVVGVGLLALIGEVAIGLSTMLVAGTRFPGRKRGSRCPNRDWAP